MHRLLEASLLRTGVCICQETMGTSDSGIQRGKHTSVALLATSVDSFSITKWQALQKIMF